MIFAVDGIRDMTVNNALNINTVKGETHLEMSEGTVKANRYVIF